MAGLVSIFLEAILTEIRNQTTGSASLDLFVLRIISFKLLYGLVILRHARRSLVRISVTPTPTAEWITGPGSRSVSLGLCVSASDSRPRWSLRSNLNSPHSRNGDQRSPYGATLAVAERPR